MPVPALTRLIFDILNAAEGAAYMHSDEDTYESKEADRLQAIAYIKGLIAAHEAPRMDSRAPRDLSTCILS